MEFQKDCEIFSMSHHILQALCGDNPINGIMTFEHDSECDQYPEVFEAWKQAGGDDRGQTVAKCDAMKAWVVGYGGKKNADRAAKLALCVCIAARMDPDSVKHVLRQYPEFKRLLGECGLVAAEAPAQPAAGAGTGSAANAEPKSKIRDGALPDVKLLNLSSTQAWAQKASVLSVEGFHDTGCAVEFSKECEIFSESHHILQNFC